MDLVDESNNGPYQYTIIINDDSFNLPSNWHIERDDHNKGLLTDFTNQIDPNDPYLHFQYYIKFPYLLTDFGTYFWGAISEIEEYDNSTHEDDQKIKEAEQIFNNLVKFLTDIISPHMNERQIQKFKNDNNKLQFITMYVKYISPEQRSQALTYMTEILNILGYYQILHGFVSIRLHSPSDRFTFDVNEMNTGIIRYGSINVKVPSVLGPDDLYHLIRPITAPSGLNDRGWRVAGPIIGPLTLLAGMAVNDLDEEYSFDSKDYDSNRSDCGTIHDYAPSNYIHRHGSYLNRFGES